jgi:hypothetical protein
VEGLVDRELQLARQLLSQKKRERALLALKLKKLHEQRLDQIDAWLLNVEGLVGVNRSLRVGCERALRCV